MQARAKPKEENVKLNFFWKTGHRFWFSYCCHVISNEEQIVFPHTCICCETQFKIFKSSWKMDFNKCPEILFSEYEKGLARTLVENTCQSKTLQKPRHPNSNWPTQPLKAKKLKVRKTQNTHNRHQNYKTHIHNFEVLENRTPLKARYHKTTHARKKTWKLSNQSEKQRDIKKTTPHCWKNKHNWIHMA